MIANLQAEDSPIARMLGIIERNAGKMMKCGGGALSREDPRRHACAPLSPERRAHVVQGICLRDGINAPDGRGMENRGRAKR